MTAFFKYNLAKGNYNKAKNDKTIPLKEIEKLYLTNAKLTAWSENGKVVSKNDARWIEKEKDTLQQADGQLEMYRTFKEDG